MSELLFGYKTGAGTTFKKVRDKNGNTRYFKDGTPINAKAWAGGQSSMSKPVLNDKGELPSQVKQADSVAELVEITNIPFDRNVIASIAEDSKNDALQAEANRFLAFWDKNDRLEREEAAKEYLKFRNEVADAFDAEQRAIIREQYGLGGS